MSEKEKPKRKTAGQISMELFEKEPEVTDVRDARSEMLKDYVNKVEDTIAKALKRRTGDFFVEVETKKERTMQNVIRNFIMDRETCPTPHFDQIVYKYHRRNDEVEFLWSIPNKRLCMYIHQHPLELPPEMADLRTTVLDFYDDTLLRKCKKLNEETINTKGIYD